MEPNIFKSTLTSPSKVNKILKVFVFDYWFGIGSKKNESYNMVEMKLSEKQSEKTKT